MVFLRRAAFRSIANVVLLLGGVAACLFLYSVYSAAEETRLEAERVSREYSTDTRLEFQPESELLSESKRTPKPRVTKEDDVLDDVIKDTNANQDQYEDTPTTTDYTTDGDDYPLGDEYNDDDEYKTLTSTDNTIDDNDYYNTDDDNDEYSTTITSPTSPTTSSTTGTYPTTTTDDNDDYTTTGDDRDKKVYPTATVSKASSTKMTTFKERPTEKTVTTLRLTTDDNDNYATNDDDSDKKEYPTTTTSESSITKMTTLKERPTEKKVTALRPTTYNNDDYATNDNASDKKEYPTTTTSETKQTTLKERPTEKKVTTLRPTTNDDNYLTNDDDSDEEEYPTTTASKSSTTKMTTLQERPTEKQVTTLRPTASGEEKFATVEPGWRRGQLKLNPPTVAYLKISELKKPAKELQNQEKASSVDSKELVQQKNIKVNANGDKAAILPKVYKDRVSWLKTACKQEGFHQSPEEIFTNKTMFNQVLKGAVRTMYVDDKHKLILCQMPKVGCSNWKRFFLIATGEVNTTDPNDITHGMFYGGPKLTYKLKWLYNYSEDEIMYRLKNYFKFVFVRNPFERILSAYRDKLEDVRPFVGSYLRDVGTRIVSMFRENPTQEALKKGNDVKFHEFVKFILTGVQDIHWKNYQNLCQPCLMPYDFVGKMESLEEDVGFISHMAGIDIKYPKTDTRNDSMSSSQRLATYYSQIPLKDVKALKQLYSTDLHVFNYTYPDVLQQVYGDGLYRAGAKGA